MSKIFKDSKGRHMWDGSTTVVTAFGNLEMWKTGEYGGGPECHRAMLTSRNVLTERELLVVAEVFGLVSGDCMGSSMIPMATLAKNANYDENIYDWTYYPSTN